LAHLLARPIGGEHPGDAGALGIALALPSGNFGFEALASVLHGYNQRKSTD
jgi:hypothetical protein